MAKNYIADKSTLDSVNNSVLSIQESIGNTGASDLATNLSELKNSIGNTGNNSLTSLISTLNTTLNLLNSRLTENRASQLDKISNIAEGVGIKNVIFSSLDRTLSTNYTDVSHSSVNINKSFILIDGASYSSSAQGSHSLYVSSRSATSFRVSSSLGAGGSTTVTMRFSYQIIEFK